MDQSEHNDQVRDTIINQLDQLKNIEKKIVLDQITDLVNCKNPSLLIMKKDFPSIDAILVSDVPCMFQITIAKDHQIKATHELVEIIKNLHQRMNDKDACFNIYFVILQANFNDFESQTITRSKSKNDAKNLEKEIKELKKIPNKNQDAIKKKQKEIDRNFVIVDVFAA